VARGTVAAGYLTKGTGGWVPSGGSRSSPQFSVLAGILTVDVSFTVPNWSAVPIGEIVSYTQGLQWKWNFTANTGQQITDTSSPLPPLDWTFYKTSATTWEVFVV
jgi:hypothetical protein